jgi:hypothetical protein
LSEEELGQVGLTEKRAGQVGVQLVKYYLVIIDENAVELNLC